LTLKSISKTKSPFFKPTKALENCEQRPGRGKEGDLFYGPYVTVSREKGAGGNAVAKLVGKRLGWQVFDNEIVDEIAKKAHIRRQLIESLDERDQATIQDMIGQLLNPRGDRHIRLPGLFEAGGAHARSSG
jgi:hypothetical protein